MIRDPSDGSEFGITPNANDINTKSPKKASAGIPSAMPPIDPVDHVLRDREQRSRKWLAEYRAKQNAARKPQEEGE